VLRTFDAFVVVTPEPNYGAPPALISARNDLYHEWCWKPMGVVRYGGVSDGSRSVQTTKAIGTTRKLMPIPEAVTIPFFAQHRDQSGAFSATEPHAQAATAALTELHRWAEALQPARGWGRSRRSSSPGLSRR